MSMALGIGVGLPFGLTGNRTILWSADFTALSAGAAATLPGSLSLASGVATHRHVQTAVDSLILSIPQNQGRIGRADAAHPLALILEGAATNVCDDFTAWTLTDCTRTIDAADPAGGTGAAKLISLGTAGQLGRAAFTIASAQYTLSVWARRTSGGVTPTMTWGSGLPSTTSVPLTTWAKYSKPTAGLETGIQFRPGGDALAVAYRMDAFLPLIQAGNAAVDCECFAGMNTRTAERLYRAGAPGRFGVEIKMRPKAARSGYPVAQPLWYLDANNKATVDPTTGNVTVTVAGSAYTTSTGVTWAAGDVVELWTAHGTGNTVVKTRVNGGSVTTLGTSGAPQGATPGGELSLLSDGTLALNSRVEYLASYADERAPTWAA